MDFLVVLVVTVLAAVLLRKPIKRYPVLFYVLAAGAVLLLFLGDPRMLGPGWRILVMLVQRCMVALALFTVVMYIGVLPKGSKVDSMLRPIRAELSIIASILCLGHMLILIVPFASRALSGAFQGSTTASFVVVVVLLALLLLLGVTSFKFVKKRMSAPTWKKVQRLAYLFFMLAYVHLLFMLAPSAALGGAQATFSIALYSAVFVAYAVLRLVRFYQDKKAECQDEDGDQGSAEPQP